MPAVTHSHETAATQFVQAGGNRLAYRRVGLMYPDASHGSASQHAHFFLEHARLFLDE